MADEVQAEARSLPLGTDPLSGQPDRGHELEAGKLSENAGVDAVGLAGQRRQAPDPLRVCDLDLPAVQLELVVHEARAVHRLDRRPQRLPVAAEALGQRAQTVGVGRCRA